jgi:hypothetical protein
LLADVVEDWVEGARWIDHPGGGFALIVETADGGRRYLPGADGKPLVVDLGQVMQAATPQAKAAGEQGAALWGAGEFSMRRVFGGIGSGAIVELGPVDLYALRDAIPGLGAVLDGASATGEALDSLGKALEEGAKNGKPLVLPRSPAAGGAEAAP